MLMLLHNAHPCAMWSNIVLILASLLQGKQYLVTCCTCLSPIHGYIGTVLGAMLDVEISFAGKAVPCRCPVPA